MIDIKKIKKKLLQRLYDKADWLEDSCWACKKGCSTCCTQSVSITSLEGIEILAYLKKQNKVPQFSAMQVIISGREQNLISTNTFAENCLKNIESNKATTDVLWNFAPCIFLKDSSCSIYPARPFSCRCFLSTVPCDENKTALVQPLIITLNTVFHQIIEHIDSNGKWGNMYDILQYLQNCSADKELSTLTIHEKNIQSCKPMPGFLIPAEEKSFVMQVVNNLFMTKIEEFTFVELLKKVQQVGSQKRSAI
jgi:Fe-S-cluster containining protein